MTQARGNLVKPEVTPYYHCMARCVRRGYLCGRDAYTGKDFSHRKQWIVDRLNIIGAVFAIDICAYAVMSNHLHLVLHIDLEKAASWTQREVCLRWNKLFKNKEPVATFLATGKESTEDPIEYARVEQIRQNLSSISWFMRCLSEPIARRANAEDEITGGFWDKRFKSQALLDEAALLACMSYVDLNPIRAGVSSSLNDSNFSSIKERIREYKGSTIERKLMPFKDKVKDSEKCKSINFTVADYLVMVDQTGRALRNGKRGYIPKSTIPILESLNIDPDHWLSTIEYFNDCFFAFVGGQDKFEKYKEARNCSRLRGIVSCNRLFRRAA